MSKIHPTAMIAAGAELGNGVEVGPYCVIGPQVALGDGVSLGAHVVVNGRTRIGVNSAIYPFAAIGHIPQDLKYDNEPSELFIGANNVIREHATMHPGTRGGGMATRVGDNCLFMVGTHVAHDCQIGDGVVMANNATLGGHVVVGEHAIIGGLAAVHQFVRVGKHAMVGGMSGVEHDVIPYGSVMGDRARLTGLNLVGLKRRRFDREVIHALRTAYRLLFASEGTMAERIDDVVKLYEEYSCVMDIIEFMRADSSRTVLQPRPLDGP